jgi:lipase chaperone LimK
VILYYVRFLDADPYLNNAQVLLLLNYFISFYIIFHHISQNLLVLREQLSIIENEDVRSMHDAVYKKYIMFK